MTATHSPGASPKVDQSPTELPKSDGSPSPSPAERPVSGDVASLLQSMEGGSASSGGPGAQAGADRVAMIRKATEDVVNALPEGSRPAEAADLEGRTLPPGSKPFLIPSGKTIPKSLLEKAVRMGIFPVPPAGRPIFDIIDEEDRATLARDRDAHLQQMADRAQRMKAVSNHLISGDMPTAGNKHIDMEKFDVGPSGFRIPDSEEFEDEPTVVDWKENEFEKDLSDSFRDATFLDAAKWLNGGILFFAVLELLTLFVFYGDWAKVAIVCIILAVLFAVFIMTVVRGKAAGYTCSEDYLNTSQKGKVAVITGGATGLGAEITKQLYRMGASPIFVLEKSYMLALKELTAIKKELKDEGIDVSEWATEIQAVQCDLGDLESVADFTKMLATRKCPIHFLILNSSEFVSDSGKETDIDPHFLKNYLGHFLLAKQLFVPINHCDGRVLVTSSQLCSAVKNADFHQNILDGPSKNLRTTSFLTSKACGILFTKMFAQRLRTIGKRNAETGAPQESKVVAAAFNPGLILDTPTKNLIREAVPFVGPLVEFMLRPLAKTPKAAAQTAFKCLFAPSEILKTGSLYNEGQAQKTFGSCNVSHEEVKANIVKLWQISSVMVYDHSFEKSMATQVNAQMNAVTQARQKTIHMNGQPTVTAAPNAVVQEPAASATDESPHPEPTED